jgi:hypothetical protein
MAARSLLTAIDLLDQCAAWDVGHVREPTSSVTRVYPEIYEKALRMLNPLSRCPGGGLGRESNSSFAMMWLT